MSDPVPFSLKPGLQGPWRSVKETLRARYDEAAAQIAALIADRKSKGVPTDDLVDWRADVGDILDEATGVRERDPLILLLERALGIANGGIRPLAPFAPDPAVEGCEVRLRALSKADVFTMRADMAAVSYEGTDAERRLRSQAAIQSAARPFLAKALVGVRAIVDAGVLAEDNLTPDDARMPDVLDALDAAGLLGAVFSCARDFQDLPVPQRELYGLPRPSTSERSTAAPAPLPAERSSAAMAAPPASTSLGIETGRQIAVPAVTSSTNPGLGTPSISIGSAEASPA